MFDSIDYLSINSRHEMIFIIVNCYIIITYQAYQANIISIFFLLI